MKVLIVEDEHKIAQSIKKGLAQEAYAVDIAFDGQSGLDFALAEPYDCIILDRMLPTVDGIEICRRLREEGNHTPILMLTAKDQTQDKVEGLDAGADDYLGKPFAFEELVARIRALTRRPKDVEQTILRVDDLAMNTATYEVTRGNRPVQLSSKEYALLAFFMRHPNKIFSKDYIMTHVWSYDADILPNTVEVYIGYLRNKIDRAFPKNTPLIQTVRGFGYKIGKSS